MTQQGRRFIGAAAVAAAMLATVGAVSADPVFVGSEIRLYDGPGGNGGGEFYADVTPLNTPASSNPYDFITFCLQRNQTFSWGTTMYIGGVSDRTDDGDVLGAGTAYLYTQFRTNSLTGYDYGAGRSNSANALQLAIWYLEGEVTFDGTSFRDAYTNVALATQNATINGLANNFITQANTSGWTDIGDVVVLNVYATSSLTTNRQDQLALRNVPEPGSMLLLGVGLLCLAGVARRRKSRVA